MGSKDGSERRERWARLRFAVVGPLLASPPPKGKLRAELERLAEREWEHPSGEGPVRFSASTIERWYYQARAEEQDPVKALRHKPRADVGRERAMSAALIEALRDQYRAHPSWSAQLHYDNLHTLVKEKPGLGPMPSPPAPSRTARCSTKSSSWRSGASLSSPGDRAGEGLPDPIPGRPRRPAA